MKPRTVKNRLNPKQRIVVVVMDVLLLTELVYSMYQGSLTPESMAGEFLRLYVPMLLVTVIGSRLIMRRLDTSKPQDIQEAQA